MKGTFWRRYLIFLHLFEVKNPISVDLYKGSEQSSGDLNPLENCFVVSGDNWGSETSISSDIAVSSMIFDFPHEALGDKMPSADLCFQARICRKFVNGGSIL